MPNQIHPLRRLTINGTLNWWTSCTPVFLSVVRIAIGLQILQYGSMKIFSYPASLSGGEALPPLIVAAGLIELFGGLFLTLGLFSRIVAFVLSGEMAFAYFLWHAPKNFWPAINGGGLPGTWCFALLFFSAAGAGPWSFDQWRMRREPRGLRKTGFSASDALSRTDDLSSKDQTANSSD
jgi:putative oxidoreductase